MARPRFCCARANIWQGTGEEILQTNVMGTWQVYEAARLEGIKKIVFTHHDPWSTETKLRRMYLAAEKYMKGQLDSYKDVWTEQPEGPEMMMAYDGLTVEL